MSEFLNSASDDQLALAICFGAVLGCGLIMHFSLHVGRMTGRIRLHDTIGPVEIPLRSAPAVNALPANIAARDKAA